VPKLCSQRLITRICRRNQVLTPHTDDAEKLRGSASRHTGRAAVAPHWPRRPMRELVGGVLLPARGLLLRLRLARGRRLVACSLLLWFRWHDLPPLLLTGSDDRFRTTTPTRLLPSFLPQLLAFVVGHVQDDRPLGEPSLAPHRVSTQKEIIMKAPSVVRLIVLEPEGSVLRRPTGPPPEPTTKRTRRQHSDQAQRTSHAFLGATTKYDRELLSPTPQFVDLVDNGWVGDHPGPGDKRRPVCRNDRPGATPPTSA